MNAGCVTGRDPADGRGISVAFKAGVITGIEPSDIDTGVYVSAGLVDLQVNGFRGLDLNDGALTPARVTALTRLLLDLGVTTYLPTLITASPRSLLSALAAIAQARLAEDFVARAIPFVHVEGPFISHEDGPRGAHPLAHVRAPDFAELQAWQDASGGLVGMVTLSPTHDGAPAFIRAACAQGIHVAIGHTSASHGQVRAAADAGATLSTHLGNGAAAMLPRHPNFLWSQLADDRLSASFIADGFHLPAETFKAMLRAKGIERSILVSDTAAPGGMPPGVYDQAIGGRVEVSAEGKLSVAGTPYLAGAGRPLCEDVAIAIGMAGLSLADGLRLATVNPGRFARGRGRLAAGAPADLITFDWQPGATRLDIRSTIIGGEVWRGGNSNDAARGNA